MGNTANMVLRCQNSMDYDYKGAYLQSTQAQRLIARAPLGYREYDEDGVELYWDMHVPLYGQQDAGCIWNHTVNDYYVDPNECGFARCDVDPGVYSRKVGPDG